MCWCCRNYGSIYVSAGVWGPSFSSLAYGATLAKLRCSYDNNLSLSCLSLLAISTSLLFSADLSSDLSAVRTYLLLSLLSFVNLE